VAATVRPDGYTAHFDNELASRNDVQIFVDAICANAKDVVVKANPPERCRARGSMAPRATFDPVTSAQRLLVAEVSLSAMSGGG
jgi:hypothetical protein